MKSGANKHRPFNLRICDIPVIDVAAGELGHIQLAPPALVTSADVISSI